MRRGREGGEGGRWGGPRGLSPTPGGLRGFFFGSRGGEAFSSELSPAQTGGICVFDFIFYSISRLAKSATGRERLDFFQRGKLLPLS